MYLVRYIVTFTAFKTRINTELWKEVAYLKQQ